MVKAKAYIIRYPTGRWGWAVETNTWITESKNTYSQRNSARLSLSAYINANNVGDIEIRKHGEKESRW